MTILVYCETCENAEVVEAVQAHDGTLDIVSPGMDYGCPDCGESWELVTYRIYK